MWHDMPRIVSCGCLYHAFLACLLACLPFLSPSPSPSPSPVQHMLRSSPALHDAIGLQHNNAPSLPWTASTPCHLPPTPTPLSAPLLLARLPHSTALLAEVQRRYRYQLYRCVSILPAALVRFTYPCQVGGCPSFKLGGWHTEDRSTRNS
ncbi:hypothetical protein BC567DRAFT_231403 [Phyllosticta citribraziliensis]